MLLMVLVFVITIMH